LLYDFARFSAGAVNDSRRVRLGVASHSWVVASGVWGDGLQSEIVGSLYFAVSSASHACDRRFYWLWHGVGDEHCGVLVSYSTAPYLVLFCHLACNFLGPFAFRDLLQSA